MTEHQSRAFVRALRDEVTRLSDKDQLLTFARRWLYDHKLLIEHDRALRSQIVAALDLIESETGAVIASNIPSDKLEQWRQTLAHLRPDGQTQQSWLWEAPAKHSTVQIAQVFERLDLLYSLDVDKHLIDLSDITVRRYARQLANRPPSAGARIKEPRRTVEVACFLRSCLFTTTDQAILMIQRRVTDLWRLAREQAPDMVNWADLYKKLLADLAVLAAEDQLAVGEFALQSRPSTWMPPRVCAPTNRWPRWTARFARSRAMDLKVRPIHHHLEKRVRAHIFLCMLAYYVEWHMREAWRELMFADCDQEAKASRDPVAPAQRSDAAMKKVASHTLDDGTPVHSWHSLMGELSTIVRNTCRAPNGAADAPTFQITTTPTAKQKRALDLINQIKM